MVENNDDKTIRFGSSAVSEDKVIRTMQTMLNCGDSTIDDPKFTYVEVEPVRSKYQPGIIFNWGCENIGFGQVTLTTKEGKLVFDDECMDKEFVKKMFNFFIDDIYERRKNE